MLGFIKRVWNQKLNDSENFQTLHHYIEIYLQFGYLIEKIELEIESRDPNFVINQLQSSENYEKIIKINFFDRIKSFKNGNNVYGSKINKSGIFYFGKELAMTEVIGIEQNRGIYENLMTFNEYQIGGVLHRKSGLIFPLYSNDRVIDDKKELPFEDLESHKKIFKRILSGHPII